VKLEPSHKIPLFASYLFVALDQSLIVLDTLAKILNQSIALVNGIDIREDSNAKIDNIC